MDLRSITPDYAVAPQIGPEDFAALAEAGYVAVICNRPDDEVPTELASAAMAEAAQAAGLHFHYLPVVNGAMTMQMVEDQGATLAAANGPVFAYCRSGTRSTIVWALSRSGQDATDDILAAASKAGYELSGLRGQIEHLASG